MKRERSVYVVSNQTYGLDIYFYNRGWVVFRDMDMEIRPERKPDLICFTGGADISPYLYGEKPHKTVYFNQKRDDLEVGVYNKFAPMGVPMAGVCRGGQLINVLNGGRLWQHVNNHHNPHTMQTLDGPIINVSSVHHQMMRPPADGLIIGWTMRATHKLCQDTNIELIPPEERKKHFTDSDIDPEEVVFPERRHVCVQYHPEFGPKDCEDRFFHLIDKYCFPETYKKVAA